LNPAAVIRLGAKRPVYKEGLNSEVTVTLADVDLALLPRFQGLQLLMPVFGDHANAGHSYEASLTLGWCDAGKAATESCRGVGCP
jgi:hypothetical protein